MASEPTSDNNEVSLAEIVSDQPAGPSSVVDPNTPAVGHAENPTINFDTDGSGHGAAAHSNSPAGEHHAEAPVEIDQLLTSEDPAFAASMGELHAQVSEDSKETHTEIEILDLSEKAPTRFGRFKAALRLRVERLQLRIGSLKKLAHSLKVFLIHAFHVTKKFAMEKGKLSAHAASHGLKASLHWFKTLPLKSKLLVFAVLVLGTISMMALKMVLKGNLLPTLEMHYLKSFADVADASFKFDSKEEMEDFTDPFFHPEHVMLIDKIVVNLHAAPGHPNPMGLFEFYVESSSDEGAIEIKDREGEVRDVISRALEQMEYEELVTAGGKNRVKFVLRRALNQFLTKGRVLRVYFRNVVLKD